MALLLDEIAWAQSILPGVQDPAWEAECKRRIGRVSEIDRRVAPSSWVREICLSTLAYRPVAMPQPLYSIGSLVTAQENSCRYCYGANRAFMKVLGYSEGFISRIERDATLAELDDKGRAFIAFCRSLARSRPRPMKADSEALVALGFTPLAVREMTMQIALSCYYNRIGLLSACPPEHAFERLTSGLLGRIVAPVMRAVMSLKKPPQPPLLDDATLAAGAFGKVVVTLSGLPGAAIFKAALDGAFESRVISRPAKALMFAVIARTLACRTSEAEARTLLAADGFSAAEIDSALMTLRSPRLAAVEEGLLSWARDTVYYQIGPIQAQTASLGTALGPTATLEAIGIAALANATVRIAMLLE